MLSLDFFSVLSVTVTLRLSVVFSWRFFFLYKAKSFITIEAIHIPKTAVT